MRCDLHVHSWYSGRAELPVLERVGRECYSEPLDVYERARRRGMDLVTLTDHDTIEGALALAHLLPLIPLFTLGVYVHERRFGERHYRAFQDTLGWPALPSERPWLPPAASLGEAA
jgi:hypothetical protein